VHSAKRIAYPYDLIETITRLVFLRLDSGQKSTPNNIIDAMRYALCAVRSSARFLHFMQMPAIYCHCKGDGNERGDKG